MHLRRWPGDGFLRQNGIQQTFSKSWAFGCNSAKIQALEARCNHSYYTLISTNLRAQCTQYHHNCGQPSEPP